MKKIASKLKWKLISVIKNAFHASVNFLRRPQYLLFYRNCIISPQEIQIYGQYSKKPPTSIIIYQNGVSLSPRIQIVLCGDQPDFLIRIRDVQYLPEDRFTIKLNGKTVCSNEQLIDPLSFRLEFSEIVIATMVKNGKDRILEWINYHLALGVDKIIVYLNNSTDGTEEVIKKINNPNVISVLFPYKPFADWHWNNIQRIQLCINANILRDFCEWVCFIDMDEFIYIHEPSDQSKPILKKYICEFKQHHPLATAIDVYSFFFTNEQLSYRPNQDVIKYCLLKSIKGAYPKIIVNTKFLTEFILTPHVINGADAPSPEAIYLGHYWIRPTRNPRGPFIFCDDIYRLSMALQNCSY